MFVFSSSFPSIVQEETVAVFVLSRKAKGKRTTEGATPNGMIKKMLDNAEWTAVRR